MCVCVCFPFLTVILIWLVPLLVSFQLMLTVLQTSGSNTSHQQKTGVNHSSVDLKCSCLRRSSLMFCSLASLSFEEAVYMQSCISYCCAEVCSDFFLHSHLFLLMPLSMCSQLHLSDVCAIVERVTFISDSDTFPVCFCLCRAPFFGVFCHSLSVQSW